MGQDPFHRRLNVEGKQGQGEQKANNDEDDDLREKVQVERHKS